MLSLESNPPPLRGKERELLERDERVISLAQRIFLDEGYHAVTIERIARMLGFSRGTLYQRFHAKEELMLELAIRCRKQINDVMEFASRIPGRPRERMVAIGEAIERYAHLYADNLRTMVAIDAEAILEKAPPAQQTRLEETDCATFRILLRIVEEAIAAGDLVLFPRVTAGSLCLALWALIYGWAEAACRPARFAELRLADPAADILRSAQRLMDGYQWKPMYAEWDYSGMRKRVEAAFRSYHDPSFRYPERRSM